MRKYLIDLGFVLACLGALAAVIWSRVALAADGGGTTVDFAPLVSEVFSALASVALALGLWAVHQLSSWLKLKQDSEVRRYLEDACYAGINLIRTKADGALNGQLSIDVKLALVAEVSQYLVDRVPDALRRFGLTGDALTSYVLGRLGEPLALPAPAAAS
ncbi:MAG: hypothetical protein PHS60_18295 [Zavarzinia sp.]|nr:hypothetical protein [Zavarzinia sp.]